MDSPVRQQSSSFDRRRSSRNSTRYSAQMEEADDEYDLDAIGISDGFRPGTDTGAAAGSSTRMSSRISTSPPPRPSSTTKPRYESFALRHDGATDHSAVLGPAALASSSAAGLLTRTLTSSTTEDPFSRPESPYEGPSAPSHPYQLYPQDAARLARIASVATTSTYQPPIRSDYTGPGGPTHPYGMYPQNTVSEADEPHATPVDAIPVGFPGRNNDYQRRLGPEGEEAADLIGPDGHTEQLPPYTQYDEAMARKGGAAPVLVIPGASGVGVATRHPESASREELVNPFESPIDRAQTSTSERQLSPIATGRSEKPPETGWRGVAKRKVCGVVPVWVFVILAVAIVIFAIIVGAAVAAVRARGRGGPPPPKPSSTGTYGEQYGYSTVTTTYDATAVATAPTNLPTLDVGTYWLNINNAQTASPDCISDTTLYKSWSCDIPPNMLRVTIDDVSEGSDVNVYMISIKEPNGTTTGNGSPNYFYGTQPPTISSDQVMDLVHDSNANRFGPAWFFQVPYDKLVIVPESALSMPSTSTSKSKRRREPRNGGHGFDISRRNIQAGEKPWFCYWNHTLLETFIYPNASSSYGSSNSSSTTTSTTTTSSASAASSTADVLTQFLPPYPKIVRVEERRFSHYRSQPYCVQMLILDNGWANVYPNPDTQQNNTIYLNETESANIESRSNPRGYQLYARDDSGDSSCSCVWLAS